MKTIVVLLALVAIGSSAPQTRKLFHEHFEDFLDLITAEAGDEMEHITEHYFEFPEFRVAMDYLRTGNFKALVYEMEDLPEFRAVVDFLEKDNIDIHFFLDLLNEMLETSLDKRNSGRERHEPSGQDFSAYITDLIDLFPKDKLNALFEEKKSQDEEFSVAIENLYSDEWDTVFTALWESEIFQKEVETLLENGIDVHLLLKEVKAVFGQD